MKAIKTLLSLALIFLSISSCNNANKASYEEIKEGKAKTKISISGAFALYPLTVLWAEEFQKIYPNVSIDISAGGAGKGMADALSGMVDLGMFSREVSPEEIAKGAWYIALAKDAVLPTINSNNPYLPQLMKRGLTVNELRNIFVTNNIKDWKDLGLSGDGHPINIYTRSDACGAAATWASYLNASQEDLIGIGVFGDPGVADAVKADKLSIGYNNVVYVYDINSRRNYPGMTVIPIDLDGSGSIEPEEFFYEELDQLMQAIRDDIYPSPPARDLYFVSNGKPQNPAVLLFLDWILAEGQAYVNRAGYVKLPEAQIHSEAQKIAVRL